MTLWVSNTVGSHTQYITDISDWKGKDLLHPTTGFRINVVREMNAHYNADGDVTHWTARIAGCDLTIFND